MLSNWILVVASAPYWKSPRVTSSLPRPGGSVPSGQCTWGINTGEVSLSSQKAEHMCIPLADEEGEASQSHQSQLPVDILSQPVWGTVPSCFSTLVLNPLSSCHQLPTLSQRMHPPEAEVLTQLQAQTSVSLLESGAQNLLCGPSQTTLPGLQAILPRELSPSAHPSVKKWHMPFRNGGNLLLLGLVNMSTCWSLCHPHLGTPHGEAGGFHPNLCSANRCPCETKETT